MLNQTATQEWPLNKKGSLETGYQQAGLGSLVRHDLQTSDGAGHGGRDNPVPLAAFPLTALPGTGHRAGAEAKQGQARARWGNSAGTVLTAFGLFPP